MNLLDFLRELKRKLQVPPEHVIPLCSIAIAKEQGNFTQHNRPYDPSDDYEVNLSRWGVWISLGGANTASLIYNGLLFLRIVLWPCGVWLMVRWSTRPDIRNHLVIGLGGKLNGTWSAELRIQSDVTSARGSTGINVGQVGGWLHGPH